MTFRARQVPGGPHVRQWATRLFDLRLHHFTAAGPGDLHDERAAFVSLVLWGELTETRFKVWPGGPLDAYHACGDLGDHLERVGTATAHHLATHRRRAGHCYTMGLDQWHTVTAKPGTWTLSLRGPVRKAHATVLRPQGGGSS